MISPWFHFEDIEGNIITEHDWDDVERGRSSNHFKLFIVSDANYNIPNVTLKVKDGVFPRLALGESGYYSSEVNFPLPINGSQLVKVNLAIPNTTPLAEGEGTLEGIVSLNQNFEDL